MKKLLAGAIPFIAALVVAAPSQADDLTNHCNWMSVQQSTASSNQIEPSGPHWSPPYSQAYYIAASQRSPDFWTSITATANASPGNCVLRYAYHDYFGVSRLVKVWVYINYSGSTFNHWNFVGRGSYYNNGSSWVLWESEGTIG